MGKSLKKYSILNIAIARLDASGGKTSLRGFPLVGAAQSRVSDTPFTSPRPKAAGPLLKREGRLSSRKRVKRRKGLPARSAILPLIGGRVAPWAEGGQGLAEKKCFAPIQQCQRTGGCRGRSGAASTPVATQAVPTIMHEYSLTLGRSSASSNSRRAPCRTLCDETQTPFERALPSPGMLQFVEHEYSLTLGRTSACTNSRRAPCSPQYACCFEAI